MKARASRTNPARLRTALLVLGSLAAAFSTTPLLAQQFNSTGGWTDWQTNGRFSGIDVRAMCQQGGPYHARYFVQFRNRYPHPVQAQWTLTSSGPTTGGPFTADLATGISVATPTITNLICGSGTSPDLFVNINAVKPTG